MWRLFQKLEWHVALALGICFVVVLMFLVRLGVRLAIRRVSREGIGSLVGLTVGVLLGGLLGVPAWAAVMWVAGLRPAFAELASTGATLGALFGLVSILQIDPLPPKWKSGWILPFLVTTCLAGYIVAWPWYRESRMSTAVDELIADLSSHGGQVEEQIGTLPELSDNPQKVELLQQYSEITKQLQDSDARSSELIRRVEETLPKAPEEKRQQLQQALKQYSAQLGQATEKYKQRGDQLRRQLKALQAAERPG